MEFVSRGIESMFPLVLLREKMISEYADYDVLTMRQEVAVSVYSRSRVF